LGNGPELAEKLSEKLPNDILIKLIDTAGLSISEQSSIMRNTDYFLGVHVTGLFWAFYAESLSFS
jgi:hypothetical protein